MIYPMSVVVIIEEEQKEIVLIKTVEDVWGKADTLYELGGSSNLSGALMTAIENNKVIVSVDHELYLAL